MKLYTQEQVVNALNRVFIESITIEDVNEVMRSLTAIELPSDQEISTIAMGLYGFKATSVKDVLEYKAFKRGAKMVINKIQGGNK